LPTVLRIDLSGELCVVSSTGDPLRGLTTYASEFDYTLGRPGKTEFPWSRESRSGERVDLWADAGCNDLFGKYPDSGTVKRAEIAVVRDDIRALRWDVEVLTDLLGVLPATSTRYAKVVEALVQAGALLDRFDEAEVAQARKVLAVELGRRAADSGLTLSAVGHAHIDLAWLWPLRETRRKTARTFATALANLDEYPDFVFGASQPQQFQWIREDHPGLWDRIRARVAEGRWEAQGAMWVEPDTNLPSGESLVRQIIHGVRFFRTEFGVTPRMLWLPDVFGYSGNLPQILRRAGIGWFMTTKLSWNKFNTFPHHSFRWTGIDGSTVLAHMAPEGTYNSSAAPRAAAAAEQKYLDKALSDHALLIFGIGDGGGGPGEEHLERLARMKDLSGLVPVRQEKAETFFERLEEEQDRLHRHRGELYFEMHQGTYTSQAENKRWNRRMEEALGELEFVGVLGELRGLPYPRAELDEIWQEVLLYQFHDILPGSSIGRVYEESRARYTLLAQRIRDLRDERTKVLAGSGLQVMNPTPWSRIEWIRGQEGWVQAEVGPWYLGTPKILREIPEVVTTVQVDPASLVLENEHLRVTFGPEGDLASVWSLALGRQALNGPGNVFTLWPDEGDAWDFSPDYRQRKAERPRLVSALRFTRGPLTGFRGEWVWGESKIVQECTLAPGSVRLDFRTWVDWNERGRMLRTAFPTGVDAGRSAAEIQFGFIERPTSENTSWEAAQYEICAHRWIDLAEDTFGVALLNDGKYGHRAKDGVLDLNLLRSPGYPDPEADRGRHEFTYSLMPHGGIADRWAVIREAQSLNQPLRIVAPGHGRGGFAPLVQAQGPFLVDTVKWAEEGRAVVVRGHEALGHRGSVRLSTAFGWKTAVRTDLLEDTDPEATLEMDTAEVGFDVGPFELVTIRFTL
jgi:alpha-mannosidase